MNENKKLNILMHDMGSITHGLIRKFKESRILDNIYIISNCYFEDIDCIHCGKSSDMTFGKLRSFIKEKNIDFAITFNEIYSASGLINYYKNTLKIPAIGVTKEWFLLEASKFHGKNFMIKNNIKTPAFFIINKLTDIEKAICTFGIPIVIKNNFLQAGFGSYICNSKNQALKIANELIKKHTFCIVEQFISGKEISQQYLWDGNTLLPLLPVKDFKKTENNYNTGGLGSYTPVHLSEEEENILNKYNNHIEKILKQEKADFTGVFTANLLFSGNEIYTFEFNMRPGITEFETIIEHMDCDLLELFYNCANGWLMNNTIKYKEGITGCISLAHKDYIKRNEKKTYISLKKNITPIDNDIKLNFNTISFNKDNKAFISVDKRFLSLICTDKSDPFKKIYKFLNSINSNKIYYRKDIGI